ncbi:hypothetical protein HT031_004262 [Scenedesmus sp. PABB004]|nr:hypothetical protein HT031_004262 [Scenedesmus sp. PABB004]
MEAPKEEPPSSPRTAGEANSSRQRASKHRRQIGLSLAQWKKAARALRLDLPEQLLAGVTMLCVLNACLLALHGLGLGDEQLATFSRPACPEHIQVFAAAIAAATAARCAAKAGPAGDKAQCLNEAAVTASLLPLLDINIWSIIKVGMTIWNGEADRSDCSAPPTVKPCPKCGTVIANGATKCPDCKHDMVKEKRKEQRRQHVEQLAEDMGIQLLLAGLDGVEDAQLPGWGNRKSESNMCKDAMARFHTTLALFDVSIHTRIVVLSKKADTWDEHTPLFTTTGESVALVSDLAIPQFGYESKTRRVYVVSFVGIGPGAYSHLKQLPGYAEIVKAQVALSQRAAQVHLQFLEASAGGGGEGGSGEADDGQRGEESAPRAEAAAPDRPPATAAGTGSMDVDGYMMMHAPPGPDVPRTHRPVERFIEERDDALLGQLSVLGQEEKWSGIMVFRSVRRGLQELPQVVEVDRGVYERDARSACVLLSHAETECLSKGGIAGVVVSTTYLDVVVRTLAPQRPPDMAAHLPRALAGAGPRGQLMAAAASAMTAQHAPRPARGLASRPTVAMVGSNVSDNDPGVLEAEKQRNLEGRAAEVIPGAPGHNPALASESEAVVAAERAPSLSMEELQEHSVKVIQHLHHGAPPPTDEAAAHDPSGAPAIQENMARSADTLKDAHSPL